MTVEGENALAQLTAATRMLAEARTLDDVRAIRDMAEAARAYAVAAKLGDEAIGHASAIKLDAERKAGVILVKMKASGERAKQGDATLQRDTSRLADLGVTRVQSSRWQALARLPDDEYADVRKSVETRARRAEDRAVGEAMAKQEDRLFDSIAPEAARSAAIRAIENMLDKAYQEVVDTRPHSPEEVERMTRKARLVLSAIAPSKARKLEVVG